MDIRNINLPIEVTEAMDLLSSHGFISYVVGGSVRDSFLDREVHDWDLCTAATPSEMQIVFKDCKCIETGLKHGTLTVLINQYPLEITTFRGEGKYEDHRHPSEVFFTKNIYQDLIRRDFTINAIAYNPHTGIVDPSGGLSDVTKGVIRAVGNPEIRFDEDALRILRGIRFSSVLGFEIEEKTANAIHEKRKLLSFISVERINSEFSRFLLGKQPKLLINEFFDIFCVFIPELFELKDCPQNNPYHVFDVLGHTLETVSNTPAILPLRLAALFHDIGKKSCKTTDKMGIDHFYGHVGKSSYISSGIMDRLRYDNHTKDLVNWLIRHHDEPLPITEIRIKKLLMKKSKEEIEMLLLLKKADILSQNKNVAEERITLVDDALSLLQRTKHSCFQLKGLEINGNDLIELGLEKGKNIGLLLDYLLNLVMENQLPNNRQVLLLEAKKQITAMYYPQDQN